MKKKSNINYLFSKKFWLCFLILVCDIALVIFCARGNKVHYAKFLGEEYLIGDFSDLILGRNYINCIITVFFVCYFFTLRIR